MRIQIAKNQEARRLRHNTCYGERAFLNEATDLKIFGFVIGQLLADFRIKMTDKAVIKNFNKS